MLHRRVCRGLRGFFCRGKFSILIILKRSTRILASNEGFERFIKLNGFLGPFSSDSLEQAKKIEHVLLDVNYAVGFGFIRESSIVVKKFTFHCDAGKGNNTSDL